MFLEITYNTLKRVQPMVHIITFDTLLYANQLKSVGVPEKQAEMQAMLEKKQTDEVCAFIDNSLATKYDIGLIQKDIDLVKKDIDVVKKDIDLIREDIDLVKKDIDLIKEDIDLVKKDIYLVKEDINLVKKDMDAVKKDIDIVKDDINTVKKDIVSITKDIKYIIGIGGIFGSMIPVGFTVLGFLMLK